MNKNILLLGNASKSLVILKEEKMRDIINKKLGRIRIEVVKKQDGSR